MFVTNYYEEVVKYDVENVRSTVGKKRIEVKTGVRNYNHFKGFKLL